MLENFPGIEAFNRVDPIWSYGENVLINLLSSTEKNDKAYWPLVKASVQKVWYQKANNQLFICSYQLILEMKSESRTNF